MDISYKELKEYFHLPINEVSEKLGICATVLKKVCRRNGVYRWPHRKISALNKYIYYITTYNVKKCMLEKLKSLRAQIYRNPNTQIPKKWKYHFNSIKRAVNLPNDLDPDVDIPNDSDADFELNVDTEVLDHGIRFMAASQVNRISFGSRHSPQEIATAISIIDLGKNMTPVDIHCYLNGSSSFPSRTVKPPTNSFGITYQRVNIKNICN